jgi:hypothetical protein
MPRPTLDEIYGSTSTTVASTRPSLDAIYGGAPQTSAMSSVSQEPTSVGSEIGTAISNTLVKPFADRFSNIDYSNQGIMSNLLQTGGALAGGTVDVAGKLLLEGAKVLTPKPVENFVGDVTQGFTQGVSDAIPEDIKQSLSSWASQHPEAAANLGAIVDIASIIPAGKAGSTIKGLVSAPSAAKLTKTAERVMQAEERLTPIYAGGKVVEDAGKVVTKPLGQSVLQNIDLKKGGTYRDLNNELETVSKSQTARVSEMLKPYKETYGVDDFNFEVSGLKYNPVKDAISSLDELASKTVDTKVAEVVQKYNDLAKTRQLTRNDINEISKKLSYYLPSFKQNGELFKRTNAVKVENTRRQLKEIALKDIPEAQMLDKSTSEILGVKAAIAKMDKRVANEIRKAQELGLIKKTAVGVANVADLLSGRFLTTALRFLQRGGSLSAMDLEKELLKNLKLLQEANTAKDKKKAMEFLKAISQFASSQAVNEVNAPKD